MLWFSFQDASLSLQDNVTNFVILILYCFKALWILLLMGKKKKEKKRHHWCFDFLMSMKRCSCFNFQHRLDLDYPLIYVTAPPCHAQPSPSWFSFLSLMKYPWWNTAPGHCPAGTETASLKSSEQGLEAWTCALKSHILGKSDPVLQTSVEIFTFSQGKKFHSLETLSWHGKMHSKRWTVWGFVVVVVVFYISKKCLRAQEPPFSHWRGY